MPTRRLDSPDEVWFPLASLVSRTSDACRSACRALVLGATLGSAYLSCGAPRLYTVPVERPPAVEEERAGEVDQTAFDFEPEPPAVEAPGLELDGVPQTPPAITASLVPYLDSRRTRLQAFGGDGASMLVITRLDEIAQAYRVSEPMGELTGVTRSPVPVVQVSSVPGKKAAYLYRSDADGSESFQIHRQEGGQGAAMISDGQSRHGRFLWSPSGGLLAYTSNARSAADMDIYLSDGSRADGAQLLVESEGSWSLNGWSPDETRLLVRHHASFTRSSLHLVDVLRGRVEPLTEAGAEVAYVRASFADDDTILLTSNREGDVLNLFEFHLPTRSWSNRTAEIPWDVEEFALSGDRSTVAFTTNEEGLSVLRMLDRVSGRTEVLPNVPPGIISSLRYARRRDRLAFTLDRPTHPGDSFSYDLSTGTLTPWTDSSAPDLDADRFVAPELVHVESFDARLIPAWIYRPVGAGQHPVLIWVHGGPEEQYQPSFHPIVQYLVSELGIAVLAPNIRGSDGYGRRYLALDDGLRREHAIADVGAMLDWIGRDPGLDPARVGIYGASYGGYVVLASMIHFPERIAAGCDLVGISNFVTFLENTSDYRRDLRRAEYGDERDPEMRAFLESISPTTHAHRITRPLFVAHGANDPRVPVGEARQIVEAVRRGGTEAWLLVAPDEGHGFQKRSNRDAFYGHMIDFFSTHLGARPGAVAGVGISVP